MSDKTKTPVPTTNPINQTPVKSWTYNQYVLCFRCGRTGHVMGVCNQKTHIRGWII